MRLSLSINDRHVARASHEGSGWLGAHVSLSNDIKSDEPANRVWLVAADISEEPNTVHSTWEPVEVSIGDKIHIDVLPDGEADPPSTVTKTSASADNLFSDVSQARLLLETVRTCDKALLEAMERSVGVEPEDELHKIRYAIAAVLAEIDQQLIRPTLQRHPELLPMAKEMKVR
ncbi:hypothetical protein [Tunturiibacter gelidoferens]|jgi:hypothetical protein|uniref:Uncharacterized protein n=1 Tax=Tunturiibacter gelidiferens TaxID=3069689 RepID=A0A9X0QJR0_9BACT|nr:hypothetical protein [Edaphobacter lichenicola]MBB5331549.1 hypothetical protein [Edaphobacter lichenicola]